jgi:predicted metalloprotease with PDZ domain
MAGLLRVAKHKVGEHQVAVAVAGNEWSFGPDELADALVAIAQAERDFFDDHSDPWYLVTLSPVPQQHPGSHSFGGTALTNCFALYCTPNLSMSSASPDYSRTLILLAHEYFHNWNGIKIPTAGEDPSTYWFSEGFTNFYARRILHRAGLITAEQLVNDLNSALSAYDKNPHRMEPNRLIVDSFWSNPNTGLLPYQRGDLLALMIDQHIRERTEGRQSLDDLMVDLFRNPLQGQPSTTEELLERIRRWVDEPFFEQVRQIVVEGHEVELPQQLSEPQMELAIARSRSFHPGIDLEATRESKRIAGVEENSNAWQAGLRNGQELRGFSVNSTDQPPIAEVTVLIDDEPTIIKYEALGPPQDVRVYRLAIPLPKMIHEN